MLVHQWRAWPSNAVTPETYRRVDPGGRPWVPSPEPGMPSLLPELDATPGGEHINAELLGGSTAMHSQASPATTGRPRRRSRELFDEPNRGAVDHTHNSLPAHRKPAKLSLKWWKHRLGINGRNRPIRREEIGKPASLPSFHEEPAHPQRPLPNQRIEVTPAEWKAYGYWARPRIGDVVVDNATPREGRVSLDHAAIEAVMRSVQSTEGISHAHNWIPRLEHPALPPRPSLWPTPPSSPVPRHLPPSSTLQLNPFLVHRITGHPPILFDMRFNETTVILGQEAPTAAEPQVGNVLFRSTEANGAQPATYPGVSTLSIIAVADEITPNFPWPATVCSKHPALPVTVEDVLRLLYDNFQELITHNEFSCLTRQRVEVMRHAYRRRVDALAGLAAPEEGFKRIDFLGDRHMFRGLEPAPDGQGFIMFVGPLH